MENNNPTTPGDTINSASGNLSIGTKRGNSETITEKFSTLSYSIKTLGGAYGYSVATPPYDVTNYSIDLTSWLQSLNDPKTHTMIDLQEGGLYPISDFILEENFKQRYNDTHMDFQHQETLEEPYIEIIKMYVRKVVLEKNYMILFLCSIQGKEINLYSQIQTPLANLMQN